MPKMHSNQLRFNGRETIRNKTSKVFINYSETIDDVYENLEDYKPKKKIKMLIVFDDMIADMVDKKIPIVTELSIRGRKLNISLVFI